MTEEFERLANATVMLIGLVCNLCKTNSCAKTIEDVISISKILCRKWFEKIAFWSLSTEFFLFIVSIASMYFYSTEVHPQYKDFPILSVYSACLFGFNFAYSNALFICFKALQRTNNALLSELTCKKTEISEGIVLKIKTAEEHKRRVNGTTLISRFKEIYDLCERLDGFFGILMVMNIFSASVEILFTCYFIVAYRTDPYMIYVLWLLLVCLAEWIVIFSCDLVMKESRKTGLFIHEIISQSEDENLKGMVSIQE